MPRISETLTLGTIQYKAIRPQDGNSPAIFREQGAKPLHARVMISIGVTTTKDNASGQMSYRPKATYVLPRSDSEGKPLPSDRLEISGRIAADNSEAAVQLLLKQLGSLVSSTEFASACAGEAQF